MNGGDEAMCINERQSQKSLVETGRPCPRVELDPRNNEAMTLISWTVHDDLKPLASQYARDLLRGRRPEERAAIFGRVGAALRTREVMSRLHPESLKHED